MKIIPKKNLPDFSLPLSIYNSIYIAEAVSRDGEEFGVFIGLNKEHAKQLKELSLDENDVDLQNNTGDKRRFGEGSYEDWYDKDRTPFCLIHTKTGALAALVWFGHKPLGTKSVKFGEEENYEVQNGWHTASFRSYSPFRGKGLMKNFSKFVIDFYREHFPNIMFWIGLDDKNKGMLALAEALGFEVDEANSDLSSNWLVMVKKR